MKKMQSNKEKMKLRRAGMLECNNEKVEINKSSDNRFDKIFCGFIGRRAT